MSLFGVNKSPAFVGLNESRTNIPNAGIEENPALLPDCEK